MPNFGVEQTQMSRPDLQGASQSFQGVPDNSKAVGIAATTGLIKDVGTAAVEARHGYVQAGMETKLDTLNREVFNRQNPDTIFTDKKTTFEQKQEQYNKALAQGHMDEAYYTQQSKLALREAITADPGQMHELIRTFHQYNSLSGAEDQVKQNSLDAKALAHAAAEKEKMITEYAMRIGGPALVSDPMREQKISDYQGAMSKFAMFKEQGVYTEAQRKAIVQDPVLLNGVFSGANIAVSTFFNTVNSDNTKSQEEKLKYFTTETSKQLAKLTSSFTTNAGEKVVQDNLDYLKKNVQMYSDIITGKLPAEMARNQNEFTLEVEKARIGAPKAAASLPYWMSLDPIERAFFIKESKTNPEGNFFTTIDNILSGKTVKADWNDPKAKKTLVKFGLEALEQAKTDPTNLGKVMESFHSTMFDPTLDGQARASAASTFVESMSQKGANEQLNKLDVGVRSQLLNDTKLYLGQVAEKLKTDTVYPDNTPRVYPRDMVPVMMGDKVIFHSDSDPATAVKMTRVYGKEINNIIGTMANLNGHGDTRKMLEDKESGLLQSFQTMSGIHMTSEGENNRSTSGLIKRDIQERGTLDGKPVVKINGKWEFE